MKFHIFSREEEKYYLQAQKFRDDLFMPIIVFLHKHKIHPHVLSLLGLFMVVPYFVFFGTNPWFSFLFLLFHLFLDALDGPLARYSHKASEKGALLDLLCDHGSFLFFFLTLFVYKLMTPFWSIFYLVMYSALIYLVYLCRKNNVVFFPVVRSKYHFYIMIFIFLVTNINLFDPFLVFFSVYMLVTNVFLFDKLRCSKKS